MIKNDITILEDVDEEEIVNEKKDIDIAKLDQLRKIKTTLIKKIRNKCY